MLDSSVAAAAFVTARYSVMKKALEKVTRPDRRRHVHQTSTYFFSDVAGRVWRLL